MERLTKVDGCGQNDLIRCFDCNLEKAGENLENCGYCEEGWRKALDRLAAYEDTGLEPKEIERIVDAYGRGLTLRDEVSQRIELIRDIGTDRLREIVEAERDGRLLVPPCKVGDTVYFRTYAKNATVDLGIQPHEVVELRAFAVVEGEYTDVGLSVNAFGKAVFLTQEEAEHALEGCAKDGK